MSDSNLHGNLLHVKVIFHVLIHCLTNNLRSLLTILVSPLGVPFGLALCFLLLSGKPVSNTQSATPSQSERQQLTWLLGFRSFELITSSWKPAHFSNAFLARVWSCWLSQFNISGSNLRLTLLQNLLRMSSGSSRRSSASITQISTPPLLALAE